MIRVNYYYNFCTGGIESALYNLRVVETIETSYTQVDQAVENVFMTIKKYINSSGTFIPVSSIYTDANGYVNLYLVPNAHYKIFLNKSGYYNVTGADYIPIPPNAYGQTAEKTFRIVLITPNVNPPPSYQWSDYITFTSVLNNISKIIYINYTDALTNTTNWQLYIYRIDPNSSSPILIQSYSGTNDTFALWKNVTTSTEDYMIIFYMNHTNFGYRTVQIYLYGYHPGITTASRFNLLFTLNYGYNPFGWANTFMFFVILGCMFSFDRKNTYMAIFLIGFILLFINIWIGIETIWTALSAGFFPIIMIFFGILMLVRDRGYSGVS
jgi:hypothetical protein